MGRPKIGEPELTRASIIDAALTVLDAEGFEALSLARIARALKVQTPALYWYFSSKAELYTYVAEAKFRQTLSSLDPSLTGRDLLWAFGLATRATQRTTRDAAKLLSITGVSDEIRTKLVPALLARVVAGNVSKIEARRTLTAIQALALGWTTFDANPATRDVARYANQGDAAYKEALAKIVFAEGVVPKTSRRRK